MPFHGIIKTLKFSSFISRHSSSFAKFPTHNVKLPKTHVPDLTSRETHLLNWLANRGFVRARKVLDEMPKRGSRHHPVVTWTSMLSKFSKLGFVDEARDLFEIMPERNVVTYNAMISGYVGNGRLWDAWRLFDKMKERNVVTWTTLLCGLMGCGMVEEGKRLFEVMPERNVVTWNSMVVGLIRNGDLKGARRVFDGMDVKDLVTWNAMINGYAENYMMKEARCLFDQMEEKNLVTWTTMVSGFCKVGDVESAFSIFRKMPEYNVVSWTAMIGGFAWNGYNEEALLTFLEMRMSRDAKPNRETCVSLAFACAGCGLPRFGMQLHAHIIANHLDDHDDDGRLFNGLVFMYSKLGRMDYAEFIFFNNPRSWTTQSCNAMISGYVEIGEMEKACRIFDRVPFHDKISWTSMINGYFRACQVPKACELFENMPEKDAVAWTVMISGHSQNDLFQEANILFSDMRAQGIVPLESTYSTVLATAGAMADLDLGMQLHCLLMKTQSVLDLILENALISMYAKCGQLNDAYCIFSGMVRRDLISWNSMIIGCSLHGLGHQALELLEAMQRSEIQPNTITFTGILTACSHSGLLDVGREVYRDMDDVYGVKPEVEHHICMVNLLGRAGKVKEAEELVSSLCPEPGVAVWGALLGMCGLSKENAEIANRAAKRLIEMDPLNAPGYVILCNMSASTGEHEVERTMRQEMRLKRIIKIPGCSWITQRSRP